jgi:hypothetical protein
VLGKGLVEGIALRMGTIFRVKIQDIRSGDDDACALFLVGGVAFGEFEF